MGRLENEQPARGDPADVVDEVAWRNALFHAGVQPLCVADCYDAASRDTVAPRDVRGNRS